VRPPHERREPSDHDFAEADQKCSGERALGRALSLNPATFSLTEQDQNGLLRLCRYSD